MKMESQNELASERDRELRYAKKEWIKLNSIDDENLDNEMNGEYKSMEQSQKKQESENEVIYEKERSTSSKSQDK